MREQTRKGPSRIRSFQVNCNLPTHIFLRIYTGVMGQLNARHCLKLPYLLIAYIGVIDASATSCIASL